MTPSETNADFLEKCNPFCGSQGIDNDSHCVRCGRLCDDPPDEWDVCPEGFLTHIPPEIRKLYDEAERYDFDPRASLLNFILDGLSDRYELAHGGLTSEEAANLKADRDSLTLLLVEVERERNELRKANEVTKGGFSKGTARQIMYIAKPEEFERESQPGGGRETKFRLRNPHRENGDE